MNDDEYQHPIWINNHQLTNEFHFVWTILEFSKVGFFNRHLIKTAITFHFANQNIKELDNKNICKLAKYLSLNFDVVNDWFLKVGKEIAHVDHDNFVRNLRSDLDILLAETAGNPIGKSSIYRRTIPHGIEAKADKFLGALEDYLNHQGTDKLSPSNHTGTDKLPVPNDK